MRKLIVLEHLSLDGVYQGPGGKDEDPSGNFVHGGWAMSYGDAVTESVITKLLQTPIDLLLGRTTYDIWASYWPDHGEIWPNVNKATKYVASNTLTKAAWGPSEILNGDIEAKVKAIKQQQGPEIHMWGSGNLLQTLLKHDLVDQFWFFIYPLTLGSGKQLFGHGTMPATFRVVESKVSSNGVVVVNYERVGK